MAKKIKCVCCGRIITNYHGNRFCSKCALFHKNLVVKIGYLNNQLKQLRKKLYGVEDGSQRLRLSKSKEIKP